MVYDIDLVHKILDDIVDSIDSEIFKGLNGGVILNDEIKYHPEAINNDLVILGEYVRFGVVKQIVVYYGSLQRLYPYYNEEQLRVRLEELINHELRHHVEYKAGVNDLVREDIDFIQNHKLKRGDEL